MCCAQVQVVALECLPRIPAPKFCRALAGEELGKRTLLCLSNSSKEVRPALPGLESVLQNVKATREGRRGSTGCCYYTAQQAAAN